MKSGSDYQRRPFSRSSSKGGVGAASTTSSRPPSAFENHIDYFREPVVKSPPEPTRVKSPEAVVRSPDPINWTVPLDTGKTFSVTQSIKDGGMIKDGYLCLGMILFRFYFFLETVRLYRVDYYIIMLKNDRASLFCRKLVLLLKN